MFKVFGFLSFWTFGLCAVLLVGCNYSQNNSVPLRSVSDSSESQSSEDSESGGPYHGQGNEIQSSEDSESGDRIESQFSQNTLVYRLFSEN